MTSTRRFDKDNSFDKKYYAAIDEVEGGLLYRPAFLGEHNDLEPNASTLNQITLKVGDEN